MKILLTGPFGNVGSHTIPELLREGHQVRAFDLDTPATRKVAKELGRKVETAWGDVRDLRAVERAATDVDAVLHLAAVIPPGSDEDPSATRAVNVGGTANVVKACQGRARKPRLLLVSTFDVHGHTQSRPPPRRVEDPVQGTDPYTESKIAAEALVRESGLEWAIFRLTDVPVIGLRDPHPIMFEIGLHNRIEALHPDDAATALARSLRTQEVWGRTLFVGGGPSCQVTYRDYLKRMLGAMGLEMLPDEAFSDADYATDWVDSTESQRLLRYQRRTFDDITGDVAKCLGWKKAFVPLAASVAKKKMLEMSPYWRQRQK
ncbi:MAG TPA: NAD(P)-dependent oxidoreductase [Anaeromyxobacteraceae bacterium]|nr:NAD(P)-dependent oxidoreductase [Anaeromyxobacteraceae bacterium]